MDCGDSSLNIHCPLAAEASDLDGFLADEQHGHPDMLWLSWVLGDFTLGSPAYTSFSKWDQRSHPKRTFYSARGLPECPHQLFLQP